MEVRLKPGQKAPMRDHPNDSVVHVKNDARFRLSFPDQRDSVFDLKAEQVLQIKAGPYEIEGLGTTEGLSLVIELK